MRVLMLPRWQHIDRPQSLATLPLEFARDLMRLDNSMEFTFALPREAEWEDVERWFVPVLEETTDRCVWSGAYARMPGRLLGFAANPTLAELADSHDVVLTNQPGGTMMLRGETDTPIVGWHLWTAVDRLLEIGDGRVWGEEDVVVECLSTLFCDVNVFESQHMQKETYQTLRRYVKPEVAGPVVRRGLVAVNGVDLTDPKQGSTPWPVMLWGGNSTALKGRDESLKVMAEVERRMGGRVTVVVCCPTPAPEVKQEHPDWTVVEGAGPGDWRWWCSRADVVICNSKTESYGVAWLEALGAGAVVVYENAWWVQEEATVPFRWPFIGSRAEQADMAFALLRRRDVRETYAEEARDWVRKMHSRAAGVNVMHAGIVKAWKGGRHERTEALRGRGADG